MTTSSRRRVPLSMWLCTAAIVAFAATALFDLGGLWRWNVVVIGLALVIAGGVRLGVELVRRHTPDGRDSRASERRE